jgi:hypothetical protein
LSSFQHTLSWVVAVPSRMLLPLFQVKSMRLLV